MLCVNHLAGFGVNRKNPPIQTAHNIGTGYNVVLPDDYLGEVPPVADYVFTIQSGARVGSLDTNQSALLVKAFPAGSTVLINWNAGARVQGAGGRGGDGASNPKDSDSPGGGGGAGLVAGAGGQGGTDGTAGTSEAGGAGGPTTGSGTGSTDLEGKMGGVALEVQMDVTIHGAAGQIWGGGGGGAGASSTVPAGDGGDPGVDGDAKDGIPGGDAGDAIRSNGFTVTKTGSFDIQGAET